MLLLWSEVVCVGAFKFIRGKLVLDMGIGYNTDLHCWASVG